MAELAVLSEHQAPRIDAEESQRAHNSPEDQEALKLVQRLYADAKRARQKYDCEWGDLWRFFLGDQWAQKRPTYRHSEVINFVFTEIQTTLALLTDPRPRVEYVAQEPDDYQYAQILAKVVESKWDANSWSAPLAEMCLDSLVTGTAIGCVPWKPELADGLGDFTFESEDPYYVFPDPNSRTKFNDEYCNYVVTAVPTDVNVVKKKYPDKRDEIKPDLQDLSSFGIDKTDDFTNVRYISPVDKDMPVGDNATASGKVAPKKVLLLTLYAKSDEIVEEEVETTNANGELEKAFQTRLKYPEGRKIVVANNVVLENGPNPYEGGKFPYARLVDYAMPRQFWGVGDVKNLKSPQAIINKLISYMLDITILMGNPVWVVDDTSLVDEDNLTNQPGLVITKTQGSQVQRMEGVQLQPHIMQAFDTFAERVWNKLASSKEVSAGVRPSDSASGKELELLQEAAQTQIRSKSRNLDVCLNELGDLFRDRINQSYTVPRIIRITNDQSAAQYFKFHVEKDPTGQRFATVQEYSQPQPGANYVASTPQQVPIKGSLDSRITTGSGLAFAKARLAAEAERLFDKGILDAEDLLKAKEYPGREEVIQKYKERMAAMAQQKAAEAAAQAPGAPPGQPQPGAPV